MAAHGGGAWKVAYADFVTAMMAFFLVMWICGQDQQMRRAVSHYFNDPLESSLIGNSKSPTRSGSVSDKLSTGNVPFADSNALGRGRKSYTPPERISSATKTMSDWIATDTENLKYWQGQAKHARQQAAQAKEGRRLDDSRDALAADHLAKQLYAEAARGIPSDLKSVHQDLLFDAIANVNWREIAEDLLRQ